MTAKKTAATAIYWIKQIIFIIAAAIIISILFIQTYEINDVSMQPTFDPQGNRVLVFVTPYLLGGKPHYGDILIIDSRVDRNRTFWDRIVESPIVAMILGRENRHLWVKRVIGLPGDHLEFVDGQVYRNGEKLVEDYLRGRTESPSSDLIVPESHIFVMGDNREGSSDSRRIGPVPVTNIQGRVILRFFPLTGIETY
ncbi:MAG TPA: signal peptidase I [Firmicutes bacterium]|nr:signal peptidase I [Bacillota bacterium]